MAEGTAFSTSGADAISRTIDLEDSVPGVLSREELISTYDIARTAEAIENGDYKRVNHKHIWLIVNY